MLNRVSSVVLNRPHLLDNYIRAQFTDVFLNADEYTREERKEAFAYLDILANLRHENAADTLRDILAN